jgi:hypothetical protein
MTRCVSFRHCDLALRSSEDRSRAYDLRGDLGRYNDIVKYCRHRIVAEPQQVVRKCV